MSLLEKFILTETMALVTESAILIRGVSAHRGFTEFGKDAMKKPGLYNHAWDLA